MRFAVLGVVGLLGAAWLPASAQAQEGLATSSTIGGHNTIQQAPSGGRPNGGAVSQGDPQGISPEEQRRLEKQNNAATQICKGC